MSPSIPAPHGALLSLIAKRLGVSVQGQGDPLVTGLHHDSRRVEPGDLFVARRGERSDGLSFLPRAVQQGAVAVLAESSHAPVDPGVPTLLVADVRAAIGEAANMIYGDPTANLDVVGITGTNGKTTSSYMVRVAIDGAGGKTGVLGTLGAAFGDLHFGAVHTTPEADEVARIAAAMRRNGATHMVMEVSSHALDQRRADGVHFRIAAFTNLTQDHLDYHKTLEAYAAAKDRLFFDLAPKAAVIMTDDAHGAELARRASSRIERCLRVSTNPSAEADVRPKGPVHFHARGLACDVLTPSGTVRLDAPFVGKHNLANLLLTIGIVCALDLRVDRAVEALGSSAPVPGRLERCDTAKDDIVVLVDYAHTPDALERALQAIRPLTQGQLLCTFGCGGDRDRSKRPLMGNIVGNLADIALVTNDNPRTEDPRSIADAIVDGMRDVSAEVIVELDRARAIDIAIQRANPGDVVLIAGKGHEPYQIIGDETHHFDDRQEARASLWRRRRALGEG
jgi:UDP-N-acetylmuramoyl-L-alanyl-D-glutamate--2,6-diaminopimelate ligase